MLARARAAGGRRLTATGRRPAAASLGQPPTGVLVGGSSFLSQAGRGIRRLASSRSEASAPSATSRENPTPVAPPLPQMGAHSVRVGAMFRGAPASDFRAFLGDQY